MIDRELSLESREMMMSNSTDPLSSGSYAALVITMVVISVLSVAGSTAVIRIAALKLNSTYQRFVFALSTSNAINCFFLILHNFLLPRNQEMYPWAVGTENSCTAMGFFLHFGALLVAMYNMVLAVYFYCSIRASTKREKLPEDVIGCTEFMTHLACLVVPVAIAATAAGVGDISADPGIDLCVISSAAVEGDDTSVMAFVFQIWLAIVATIAVAATFTVYCKVRSALKRVGDNDDEEIADDVAQRLAAVSAQSVLYTGIFANSFLWPTLAMGLVDSASGGSYFALQYLAFFMYPLQGFLNCFIYIRPRFQMLRVMYPDDSRMVVFRVALSTAGDPDEIEHVRGQIYGDAYEPPSIESSQHSLASDLPNEVSFDPESPMKKKSLYVHDDDELDPEPEKKIDTGDDVDSTRRIRGSLIDAMVAEKSDSAVHCLRGVQGRLSRRLELDGQVVDRKIPTTTTAKKNLCGKGVHALS